MKDYWSKLKLNECWSEKQRFNIIMNYVDSLVEDEEEEEEEVVTKQIQVSIKDTTEANVKSAVVVLSDDGTEEYTCTTGDAGGCKLQSVPLGEYSVSVTAEGYEDLTDTFTVGDETESLSLVLTPVEEQQGTG